MARTTAILVVALLAVGFATAVEVEKKVEKIPARYYTSSIHNYCCAAVVGWALDLRMTDLLDRCLRLLWNAAPCS